MIKIFNVLKTLVSSPSLSDIFFRLAAIPFRLFGKVFLFTQLYKKGNPVTNYRATNTPQCFLSIDCVGLTKSRLTSKLIQIFFIVFLHWSKAGGDPTLLPYRINALSFYRLSFEVGL